MAVLHKKVLFVAQGMTDVDQKALSRPSVMSFLTYDFKISIAGEETENTKKAL